MSELPKVIISPLLATSTLNQVDLIKKLLAEKGFQTEFKSTISIYDIKNSRNYAFLWFTLMSFRYIGDAVFPFLECEKPKAVYVTIEGIPSRANVICSSIPRLQFIANSGFTKKCLEQVGLKVIDVIHHAVNYKLCQEVKMKSNDIKSNWTGEYGSRTKLIYIGRNDPRKALDRLAKALDILDEETRNKFILLLFSDGELGSLTKHPNVISLGTCGTIPYDQVLALMGAADYLIFPSISEGFGLPVLEANAMGIPAIHCWFPPLSEFSSKDFNFVWGYQNESMVNNANVQYWIFHEYRPELMAEMITQAINIHQTSRQEYDEYCQKALDHTKQFDYRLIYPKLLKHLGVE